MKDELSSYPCFTRILKGKPPKLPKFYGRMAKSEWGLKDQIRAKKQH